MKQQTYTPQKTEKPKEREKKKKEKEKITSKYGGRRSAEKKKASQPDSYSSITRGRLGWRSEGRVSRPPEGHNSGSDKTREESS